MLPKLIQLGYLGGALSKNSISSGVCISHATSKKMSQNDPPWALLTLSPGIVPIGTLSEPIGTQRDPIGTLFGRSGHISASGWSKVKGRGLGNQPLALKPTPPHLGSPVKLNRAAQGVLGATSSAHISGVWAGIWAWTTTKPPYDVARGVLGGLRRAEGSFSLSFLLVA